MNTFMPHVTVCSYVEEEEWWSGNGEGVSEEGKVMVQSATLEKVDNLKDKIRSDLKSRKHQYIISYN